MGWGVNGNGRLFWCHPHPSGPLPSGGDADQGGESRRKLQHGVVHSHYAAAAAAHRVHTPKATNPPPLDSRTESHPTSEAYSETTAFTAETTVAAAAAAAAANLRRLCKLPVVGRSSRQSPWSRGASANTARQPTSRFNEGIQGRRRERRRSAAYFLKSWEH